MKWNRPGSVFGSLHISEEKQQITPVDVISEKYSRARFLVQVKIYRRLRIGRDGHLDQSEAYDNYRNLYENTSRGSQKIKYIDPMLV